MIAKARVVCASFLLLLTWGEDAVGQNRPEGELTIASTPFVFLYALHDALIKPLPGNNMAPCLAESWKESSDGPVYEFKLREGLRFTAEDVKFSFARYRESRWGHASRTCSSPHR
jgi:ABC-type transport system substrate-binding protein